MDQMIAGEIRDLRQTLDERNKLLEHGNALVKELREVIAARDQRIAQLEGDNCIQVDTIKRLRADLETKEKRIADLEKTVREHEEDCACLPEDRSVTETVAALNQRIADLESKLAKCTEAVQDALAQAQGDWDAVDRHPASIHADAVAYYQKVLKETALADPPAGAEKEKKGETDG